jgi:membrane-associated phospholipid phosphatase
LHSMAVRKWIAVQTLIALFYQFRGDAQQLPRRAWWVWLMTLLVGAAIVAGVTVLLVWAARPFLEGDGHALDEETLLWLTEHSPLTFADATWLGAPADPTVLFPVVFVTVFIAIRKRAPLAAATMLASFSLVIALLGFAWLLWDRPRPTLIADGIAAPALHSFPSGHIMMSITVYGLLCYFWLCRTPHLGEQVAAVLFTGTLLVVTGFCRLLLGVHWPSDTIAATMLGLLWLGVTIVALRWANRVACPAGEH